MSLQSNHYSWFLDICFVLYNLIKWSLSGVSHRNPEWQVKIIISQMGKLRDGETLSLAPWLESSVSAFLIGIVGCLSLSFCFLFSFSKSFLLSCCKKKMISTLQQMIFFSYRDIPMPLVSSGVEHGNLRELAFARMKDLGIQVRIWL